MVEVVAPTGPQRGAVTLQMTAPPAGRAALTSIRLDGVPIESPGGPELTIDRAWLTDGEHVVTVEAEDRSRQRNRATVIARFVSDNSPPKLEVAGAPARLRAGQTAVLRLSANEPAELSVSWAQTPLTLHVAPPTSATTIITAASLILISAPVNSPAGEGVLRLGARDVAGNVTSETTQIPVDAAALPRQTLLVPPFLAPLATGPVATAEAAQLLAVTSPVRLERLWSGEFKSPLAAGFPRTTGFGDRRDYVDGHVAFHAGYDVAAPEGTPVLAVAGAVVAFTGPLPQRGNTVVLDHGWGLFSVYGHLSQVLVQPGQDITQGLAVGLVGNTGLSTGSHLHWEIRLRGQAIDPGQWLALSREL